MLMMADKIGGNVGGGVRGALDAIFAHVDGGVRGGFAEDARGTCDAAFDSEGRFVGVVSMHAIADTDNLGAGDLVDNVGGV